MTSLRDLPSVEQLLQTPRLADLMTAYGRPLTLDALRLSLDETRAAVRTGLDSIPSRDQLISRAESLLAEWTRPTLQPVINATGVILHTNLGRAPMSRAARRSHDTPPRWAIPISNLTCPRASAVRGLSTPKPCCKN